MISPTADPLPAGARRLDLGEPEDHIAQVFAPLAQRVKQARARRSSQTKSSLVILASYMTLLGGSVSAMASNAAGDGDADHGFAFGVSRVEVVGSAMRS